MSILRKKGWLIMEFDVHVHINGKEVPISDLPNYVLSKKGIDLIFNDIVNRETDKKGKVEKVAS